MNKPPIFVLGCQRSGTSMLRRIIDSHPNIACPPESAFFVQLARVYEVSRAREGLQTMGFTNKEILEQMRIFTSHFFDKYAEGKGKERWADKTAPHINHANTIDKMFKKNVVYIGIVRHGLDVAYSLINSNLQAHKICKTEEITEETAAIRFWKMQNEKLVEFAENVEDRIHFIKYEDITTKPKQSLKKMFEFLDEPWDDKIIDFYQYKHDPGFDDPKVDTYKKIAINSNNYKKWDMAIQRHLWQQGYAMLNHFNYVL